MNNLNIKHILQIYKNKKKINNFEFHKIKVHLICVY